MVMYIRDTWPSRIFYGLPLRQSFIHLTGTIDGPLVAMIVNFEIVSEQKLSLNLIITNKVNSCLIKTQQELHR